MEIQSPLSHTANEITKAIDNLEGQNIIYGQKIADAKKDIATKTQLRNQYASDHSYLSRCYQSIEMLRHGKRNLRWYDFSKHHRVGKDVEKYKVRILRQLDEIIKYDKEIGKYLAPNEQCKYLNKAMHELDIEIDGDKAYIQELKQSMNANELLIDKYVRDIKQYQIYTYGIPLDSIKNIDDISQSCSTTLVSMMKEVSGERLEELRKHYYDFIVNDDSYDGLYPYHLKNMQYPQDLIKAVRKINDSNDCYDERFQIENTTMLCKMVMNGVTLEEIMEHKNDVADSIAYLYEINSLRRHSKSAKQKEIEMER